MTTLLYAVPRLVRFIIRSFHIHREFEIETRSLKPPGRASMSVQLETLKEPSCG